MAGKPWEKYAAAPTAGKPWEKYGAAPAPAEGAEPDSDALDTFNSGAGEIGRNIPVAGPLAAKAGHGLAALLTRVTPDGALPENLRNKSVGELYDYFKAQDDAEEKRRSDAHPVATTAGALAGSMAVPLPGAGVKGLAGVGARIGGNAALSAADSAVRGESGEDIAKSGGLAGGITAGLEALPVVGRAAGYVGKKAGRVLTGVPEAAAEHYLANPEAVNAAKSLPDQTKAFLDKTDELGDQLSGDSSHAFNILGQYETHPDAFTGPLKDQAERLEALGNFGPERKSAVKYLHQLADDVAEHAGEGGTIGLDKGKGLLNVLDKKIQVADKQGADAQTIKAFREARKSIDNFLKGNVPEYADQMSQLSGDTQALTGLTDKFRTERGAQNTLKRIQSGKDQFSGDALKNFDQRFGTQFGDDLRNSYVKDAFNRDTTAGSRKTVLGSVIGGAVGSGVGFGGTGAAIGSAAGAAADKYGGRLYKAILDGTLKAGPYTDWLKQIYEKRGPAAVAAAHQLLMERDPSYAKANGDQE